MRFVLAILGWTTIALAAEAAPMRLGGAEIQAWVAGAVVDIDAPMGGTISIKLAPDGTLTGNSGSLGFLLGGTVDNGRWWIAGDVLCKKWSKWFDGDTQCLEIRRDGARIYWRTDKGKEGTATRVTGPPDPSPVMVAKPAGRVMTARANVAPANAGQTSEIPESSTAPTPPRPAPVRVPRLTSSPAPTPATPPAPAPARRATPGPAVASAGSLSSWRSPPASSGATSERGNPPDARSLRVVGVEADDVLWVRRGPGTAFAEVGYLSPYGRRIQLIGPCEAEWCRVHYKGLTGWASTRYLAADSDIR
jgi:hypothetical protein